MRHSLTHSLTNLGSLFNQTPVTALLRRRRVPNISNPGAQLTHSLATRYLGTTLGAAYRYTCARGGGQQLGAIHPVLGEFMIRNARLAVSCGEHSGYWGNNLADSSRKDSACVRKTWVLVHALCTMEAFEQYPRNGKIALFAYVFSVETVCFPEFLCFEAKNCAAAGLDSPRSLSRLNVI